MTVADRDFYPNLVAIITEILTPITAIQLERERHPIANSAPGKFSIKCVMRIGPCSNCDSDGRGQFPDIHGEVRNADIVAPVSVIVTSAIMTLVATNYQRESAVCVAITWFVARRSFAIWNFGDCRLRVINGLRLVKGSARTHLPGCPVFWGPVRIWTLTKQGASGRVIRVVRYFLFMLDTLKCQLSANRPTLPRPR